MTAFIVDYVRTPIGRYGGGLAGVRTDDLAAVPIVALLQRHPELDPARVDDVILGATNQAGEDNRNVGRMAALLAGLPVSVPGVTLNRLCGSGMEAVADAARRVTAGEGQVFVAGGVESMSRAPFVVPKPERAYPRKMELVSTTLGWRLVNPRLEAAGHTDALGVTAENVAREHGISRQDQDAFALRSQQRAAAAAARGFFEPEIVAVPTTQGPVVLDEHPRPETTLERLAALPPVFMEDGTVTAGNASGINDGAAALLIADEQAVEAHGWQPLARVVASAVAGVAPRVMGLGPIPATEKLFARTGHRWADIGVVELNEAFASQALACLRAFGLADDAEHVNPNGGAIALGHPTGMTGARLVGTLARELDERAARWGVATMCIGVGQGVAMLIGRV